MTSLRPASLVSTLGVCAVSLLLSAACASDPDPAPVSHATAGAYAAAKAS